MSESSNTRLLCRYLEQHRGCQCYPLIASEWTPMGWPDRLIITPAWAALIEFKAPGERLSKKQVERCKLIMDCNSLPVVGCGITRGLFACFDPMGLREPDDWETWPKFIEKVQRFISGR